MISDVRSHGFSRPKLSKIKSVPALCSPHNLVRGALEADEEHRCPAGCHLVCSTGLFNSAVHKTNDQVDRCGC